MICLINPKASTNVPKPKICDSSLECHYDKSPDYAQPNIPALQLKGLSKTYHNGFTALKGIDLTVPQGSFFCVTWS